MATSRDAPKERKCKLCQTPMVLGDARCGSCGGPAESRSGYSRCGKALAKYPRIFPSMERMDVAQAIAAGKVVLCESCGWRQANLKPATQTTGRAG